MTVMNQNSSSVEMKDIVLNTEPKLLKIGDVAKKTGITLRTLRYYEELSLIEPDNRSKGNFRLYHPNIIQRVQFINSLKKLDFSLEEIRDIVGPAHTLETDRDIIDRTRKALLVKKEKITAKLIEMADMNREVDISLRILDDCMACKQDKNTPCDPDCENKHAHL
jgi:DNA-binding transcriptional MerR regulator